MSYTIKLYLSNYNIFTWQLSRKEREWSCAKKSTFMGSGWLEKNISFCDGSLFYATYGDQMYGEWSN